MTTSVKLLIATGTLLLILAGTGGAAEPWPPGSPVTIGVVLDSKGEVLQIAAASIEKEIGDLLGDTYPLEFRRQVLAGEPTRAEAEAALHGMLSDPEVDIVLAAGYVVSTVACKLGPLPKPLVAPFALDADLQGLKPAPDGGSGIRNLVYVASPSVATLHLDVLTQLTLVRKVALMGPPIMFESDPGFHARAAAACRGQGVELVTVPLRGDIAAALAAVPSDVDAVSALTSTLTRVQVKELADGLKGRRLPSFSFIGAPDVEQGFLCGTMTTQRINRFSRRLALNLQRILRGTPPEALPVAFSLDDRLTINMETARAIGVSPRWDLRLEAELLYDGRPATEPPQDLGAVMREAMRVNLDLKAEVEFLASGEQSVRRARANLLPQLELGARGALIDEDRAAASFGSAAERTATATASLSQVIWSEAARANHAVQGHLQRSREQGLAEARLDVALEAALAYLNVLRADTAERITLDDLRLTQSHLELARVRDRIGVAGPAEIYRWEAQQAQQRSDLIQANRRRNTAEIELNRVLNRPLEMPVSLAEVSLEGPYLALDGAWLDRYVTNPVSFRALRQWMTEQSLGASPELRALDASIAARRRRLSAADRAYYVPTVALFGSYERVLDKAGAGAGGFNIDPTAFPPDQQGLAQVLGSVFPESPDDDNWTLGVSFSLPLFQGGERRAVQLQARSDLALLQRQRDATAERIVQRVLVAAHTAGASFANIRHSQTAADAAHSSLEVVADAYAAGTADVVDLLDAQNTALVAELVAASAIFDFLTDYFRTERSMGRFTALMSGEERAAHMQKRDLIFESLKGLGYER